MLTRGGDGPLSEQLNLVDVAIRSGIFQTFTRLLQGSKLEQELRTTSQYTLFAPADIAFAYLPDDMLTRLVQAHNVGMLSQVLRYHVASQPITSDELAKTAKVKTVSGKELVISHDGALRVSGAKLLHADISARNGIIHAIDRMLLPTKLEAAAGQGG